MDAVRRVNPEKHEEKRRDILDAARKCIATHGFDGASIADICKAARISPGHLYHYFKNKEAICEAIAEDALNEGAEAFRKLVEETNVLAALGTVIGNAKSNQVRKDFPLLLEIVLAARRNPRLGKTMKEYTRRMRTTLAGMLEKGQAVGIVDA